MDSTNYFFYEWGCEGESHVSFGKYAVGKDKQLIFKYLPFDSIAPYNKIVPVKSVETNDSLVTITFYDRYRCPLTYNLGVRLIDTSNTEHEIFTEGLGQIQVNRYIFKYVYFLQLLGIYGDPKRIAIKDESLDIYLNLPAIFFFPPNILLDKPGKLNLQLRREGLFDLQEKKLTYVLD